MCSIYENGRPVPLTDGALGLPPLMDLDGIVVGFVRGDEDSGITISALSLRPDNNGFDYSGQAPRELRGAGPRGALWKPSMVQRSSKLPCTCA
ncbi:MAG TPA: hypothetical protein VGF63_13960 [Solirubrobacteraceae bacterium]